MKSKLALKTVLIIWVTVFLNGCSFFVSKASQSMGENLSQVILNYDDPETVADAIPAYLLLSESLVIADPENAALLASTSTLYSSSIALLVDEPEREKKMSDKALDFALRSACIHDDILCQLNKKQYQSFEQIIMQTSLDDIDVLYTLGVAWASWIQANKSDWNAIAQLAQVKLIMRQVVALDNEYKQGNGYVYLGVLSSLLPPALGGTPEIARKHFEQALKLSEQRNLMVHVMYAKQYARMMFDRELHDRLLNTVMSAQVEQIGLTLMNTLARRQAKVLLNSAEQYF